jgi:hypothetical protein
MHEMGALICIYMHMHELGDGVDSVQCRMPLPIGPLSSNEYLL